MLRHMLGHKMLARAAVARSASHGSPLSRGLRTLSLSQAPALTRPMLITPELGYSVRMLSASKEFHGHKPFELRGAASSAHDTAEIERLLKERLDAQKLKDYETADSLQAQVEALNVIMNDRERVYFCVSPEQAAMASERRAAKDVKDYDKADRIRSQLEDELGQSIGR